MKPTKSKYKVKFMNESGKAELVEVEADSIVILDSIEDSLICFNSGTKTTFCLPFSSLIFGIRMPMLKTIVSIVPK